MGGRGRLLLHRRQERPRTTAPTAAGSGDNPYADTIGGGPTCFFTDFGSKVSGNVFAGNGFFGQPTNGDLADLSDFSTVGIPAPAPGHGNCWHGNIGPSGVTS